ncbi:hypothetical protein PHYPO_G00159680 [Pangasianodon hypophthalmus]|uniref:Uncharacterized protein n=1 Tax=Pangasianodon hypophthalmus TaxID=310915 RepID=A0A5N5JTN7_PANHP|nr:hypothetical protein PHYPO_G00159680 [Pangasianodon hypophthalmus]
MDGLASQSDSLNGNAFVPAHRLVTRSFRFERTYCALLCRFTLRVCCPRVSREFCRPWTVQKAKKSSTDCPFPLAFSFWIYFWRC